MSSLAIPLVCKTAYDNNLLVVYDGVNGEASISQKSHDPKVAGVTTDYNNAEIGLCDFGENPHRLVAIAGRVLCNIKGPIAWGDCVVTSDIPGVGQKLDATKYIHGCIVGKALGKIIDDSVQLIEVAVTTA